MGIIDFIDSECWKFNNCDCTEKADNLLAAVIEEIERNRGVNKPEALNSTLSGANLMNETEYVMELLVLRFLLEYYHKTHSFQDFIHPFPETKIEYRKYKEIKDALRLALMDT